MAMQGCVLGVPFLSLRTASVAVIEIDWVQRIANPLSLSPGTMAQSAVIEDHLTKQSQIQRTLIGCPRGATTMETTKHNLQSLRDEFGALAAEVTRLMENSDQHEADELKNRIDQVRAKFESAVSDVSDSSRDAIHELSKNIADVVEESLRERPIATLALALGVGFIVGTALRR